MRTIAVTYWNTIVSPLYDASCRLMIARGEARPTIVDIRDLSLFDRAEFCAREGVEILICGAISGVAQTILEDKGIAVVPWIRGPVDEVIEACARGVDVGTLYAMPGCRRGRCAHRRQRRGGGRKRQW